MKRRASHKAKRHTAFTIVEMLLVIAIIGLLAALLAPVLGSMFGRTAALQCQTNLRTIGSAYRQYLFENNGTFPPLRSATRPEPLVKEIAELHGLKLSNNAMAGGMHWSIVLYPYIGDIRLYTCPADPAKGKRGDIDGTGVRPGSPFDNAPPLSYGLNKIGRAHV